MSILGTSSLVLNTINCDSRIEVREYKTVVDFINHVDTVSEEEAWTAPVLDDKVDSILIDGKEIDIEGFNILNDFYLSLKASI
jgi:hypothetical protein